MHRRRHPWVIFKSGLMSEGAENAGSNGKARLEPLQRQGSHGCWDYPGGIQSRSPKLEPSSLLRWVCSSPWWKEAGGQGRASPKAPEGPLRPCGKRSSPCLQRLPRSGCTSPEAYRVWDACSSLERGMLFMAISVQWLLQ